MNHYLVHDTPLGELILKSSGIYLIAISFKNNPLNQNKYHLLRKNNFILEKTATQLDEYFFHNRKSFTIDYTLNISPFFKKVLQKVSLIKFGEVQSYKQIAKSLKRKKAFRAVANANANNPIPIIIPCHRVIKSSGEIGGYLGGIANKRYLLDFESKIGVF